MGMSSCLKPVTMIFLALLDFTVFQPGNTQWHPGFNPENYLNEELLTGFDDTKNYFISPASIKATLGMVLEGSRGDGAVEIGKAIGIPLLDQSRIRKKLQNMLYDLNDNTHGTTVQSANAAFLSKLYSIIPEYQQNIRRYYSAEVHPIDFSKPSIASNTINSWVRTSTTGLIPEIVSPEMFNADTEFVLANALYFKGQWKFEFDERSTVIKCFHTRKHGCINAKMMHTVDQFYYRSFDELSAQAIQLPYGDGRYAMVVLLPSEKNSVERLVKDLQHYSFLYIVRRLEPRHVSVNLPKFEIDYIGDIIPFLKNLGVTEIFNEKANLSGIIETGQVKVNNIVHKAKIEVNEKGTGAIAPNLMGSPMTLFMADRPFLFFIYHVTSNNIIFEGRLNEVPNANGEIFIKPSGEPVSQNQSLNQLQKQPPNKQQEQQISKVPVFQSGNTHKRPHLSPTFIPDDTLTRYKYFDLELLTGFDDTQNYFISPASIKTTLGMVLEGARGQCAEEISKAMRLPRDRSTIRVLMQNGLYYLNENSSSTVVQSANAAFISKLYHIIPEYKQNVQRHYSADIHPTDFSKPSIASTTINSWVKAVTNGVIPEIVSPDIFNVDATFVLANALNFKGKWKTEFEKPTTGIECFHTRKRGCINAKMMRAIGNFNYKFIDDLASEAIQLPYGDNGKYAMVVLLPSVDHSVERLIKDLQHFSFANIVNKLEPTKVWVDLPNFEIDYSGDIVPLLKTLGVQDIFNQNANLSGIVEKEQVKVNNFFYKAKIEVNEEGTIKGDVIAPRGSEFFIANRPFLFFIYHVESKNILFEGRLNEVPEIVEPSTEPFTEPSTEPFTAPFTEPSTETSTELSI